MTHDTVCDSVHTTRQPLNPPLACRPTSKHIVRLLILLITTRHCSKEQKAFSINNRSGRLILQQLRATTQAKNNNTS